MRIRVKEVVQEEDDLSSKAHHRLLIELAQVLLLLLLTTIVMWPILRSAFSADDTFDSFVPFQLRYSQQSIWTFISSVHESWKVSQGRFFPIAITIGTLSHYFFPERIPYKILQFLMATTAIFAFLTFVKFFTKNLSLAILASVIALSSTQIHVQYDPIIQFSLQQPALVLLLFTAFLFFLYGIRKNSPTLFIFSGLAYLSALLTYETTVLLWLIFPLLIVGESPKRWKLKLASTMIAPSVVMLNLLYLRSQVTGTAPGYTSNFAIEAVATTFVKQLVASIPMSFVELNTPSFALPFPRHLQFGVWNWWLSLIATAVLLVAALKKMEIPSVRTRLTLVGIGLVLWLTPALVVAQTVRWQSELVLGNGYITAYQGYFGFSLVAVGVISQLFAFLRNNKKLFSQLFSLAILMLAVTGISSVVSNNPRAVAQYDAGYLWPREHFERAIRAGVFDGMSNGETGFSPQGEWWFNAPFVNWYGGPRMESLISSRDVATFSNCVEELQTCQKRLGITHAFVTFGRFPTEPRVTLVGQLQKISGQTGNLNKMEVNQVTFYIDYPTQSKNVNESRSRCEAWLYSRVTSMGVQINEEDVDVRKASEGNCLVRLSPDLSLDSLLFAP